MSTDLVSVGNDLKDIISVEDIDKYPELLICLEYLILKDSTPSLSMEQIGDMLLNKFGNVPTTRVGLYYRIESWRKNGTMRRAEEVYLIPKIEEMRTVVSEAITSYPSIVRRLIVAATTSANARDTLEIIKYLRELMQPELEKIEEVGDREIEYAQKKRNFNPMNFVEKVNSKNGEPV